ncbi:MAG: hypothetical protein JWN48_4279 [Myxococcaceae bacterium]|nr:hypothetical protein [Myxococcaceae bacterium]
MTTRAPRGTAVSAVLQFTSRFVLLPLVLLASTACATPLHALHAGTAEQPKVQKLELGIANLYVIHGERPILVDTSTSSEFEDLSKSLAELQVDHGKLALLVVTHCHADHAGGAKQLRAASKVPIAIGSGDLAACAAGKNGAMPSMSLMASILKPFIGKEFPGFKPDITVTDRLDLRPYGVAGDVIQMPGHTPGSVIVLLDNGDAFLGDMFAGGRLGGGIRPSRPQTHYYHQDQKAAESSVCKVIDMGAKQLYLGHGGPVTAAKAWQRFCTAETP